MEKCLNRNRKLIFSKKNQPKLADLHSEYQSYKKVLLESVEKVVSKSECRKLFQLGLNYHNSHNPSQPKNKDLHHFRSFEG